MNSNNRPSYGHPATASDFLIHQTEASPFPETGETSLLPGWSVAKAANPDILTATETRQKINGWGDAPAPFGIIVARMDVLKTVAPDTLESDLAGAVSKITKAIAPMADEGSLMAYVAPGEFALAIPEVDAEAATGLGVAIRKATADETGHSVTIGIAHYPTLDYPPVDILSNARKAVDHAAFFGANSQASFDAVTLNISGDQFYQHGAVNQAMEEFEKGLTLDPDNVNLHNSIGVCFGIKKDFASAMRHFETAISLDDHEVMAVYNIGMVLQLQNKIAEAKEKFETALSMDSSLFEARFQLAKIEIETEQFEAARPLLNDLVAKRPDSAPVHRLLGQLEAHSGNLSEAIFHYKKAIKINPDDAHALGALGKLFEATNESQDIALMFCEQSVRLSPEDGEMQFFLGQMYIKHGRLEDAKTAFSRSKDLGVNANDQIADVEARMAAKNAS